MSRLQSLKLFIHQRLAATVEEVIGHLERTLTEYEDQMECRHCRLLAPVSDPQHSRKTTEIQQLVIKDELCSEQQQWTSSLNQDNPVCQHIKDEEPDFWPGLEPEQLQMLYEDEVPSVPFTAVSVKHTDPEEEAQSSQLHHRRTEENPESPGCGSAQQIKTEEDCGGPPPGQVLLSGLQCPSESDDRTSRSAEAETEDRGDGWREMRKPQTPVNISTTKAPVNDVGGHKMFGCSKCGKRFGQKHHLQTHMRCHTGEKPFSCSLCGKRFTQKGNMTQHLAVHTREKPCSCPVCGERFAQKGNLTQHMTVHTREKLCW
ncbi:myeloid zinc finger 1-like [Stegastes partitus]|uniref:Myeloid zinc finger 1-like n=1 Tax=Stegastes partitus TaxID=144197 RepID=A0A9Y4KCE1_9TELE|nr:PREDICTED: myeloid zinc finger 1-like [Stegastes partitus]